MFGAWAPGDARRQADPPRSLLAPAAPRQESAGIATSASGSRLTRTWARVRGLRRDHPQHPQGHLAGRCPVLHHGVPLGQRAAHPGPRRTAPALAQHGDPTTCGALQPAAGQVGSPLRVRWRAATPWTPPVSRPLASTPHSLEEVAMKLARARGRLLYDVDGRDHPLRRQSPARLLVPGRRAAAAVASDRRAGHRGRLPGARRSSPAS
ncbi:hypothetical protein QJS66_18310 [Kocuria rhizophila]|nr:hypothetical protein QJS66_18310 [Kocuria rhizophila]